MPADRYAEGSNPPSFDKQFVRDWLESVRIDGQPWDKTPPSPRLPQDVIQKTAELSRPALLSRCVGNLPLASGDSEPAGKKPQPAAAARGTVTVEAVSFPKLRSGGELVELRVRVPADRLVMLARSRP